MNNNFIYAAKTINDYNLLKTLGVKHIIVGGENFSRTGEFNNIELFQVMNDAKQYGINLQVECDVLPTQQQFQQWTTSWEKAQFPQGIPLRILDLGLIEWFHEKKNHPLIPLLEAGFHNSDALKKIHHDFDDQISHYVLSKELTFQKQLRYQDLIFNNKAFEIAFFSPILLFYSPRKLLHAHLGQHSENTASQYLQTTAASQESVHKGFIVRENQFGTLFFHPKYQSLLTRVELIKNCKNCYLNVDLRLIEDEKLRTSMIQEFVSFEKSLNIEQMEKYVHDNFPFDTTRGFFDVNKTDVLFHKLKNHHRTHLTYRYVGDVLDVSKGESLILNLSTGEHLKLGDQLYLQSPQGDSGQVKLTKLTDLMDRELLECNDKHPLIKINYMKHFPAKSAVFKIHDNILI